MDKVSGFGIAHHKSEERKFLHVGGNVCGNDYGIGSLAEGLIGDSKTVLSLNKRIVLAVCAGSTEVLRLCGGLICHCRVDDCLNFACVYIVSEVAVSVVVITLCAGDVKLDLSFGVGNVGFGDSNPVFRSFVFTEEVYRVAYSCVCKVVDVVAVSFCEGERNTHERSVVYLVSFPVSSPAGETECFAPNSVLDVEVLLVGFVYAAFRCGPALTLVKLEAVVDHLTCRKLTVEEVFVFAERLDGHTEGSVGFAGYLDIFKIMPTACADIVTAGHAGKVDIFDLLAAVCGDCEFLCVSIYSVCRLVRCSGRLEHRLTDDIVFACGQHGCIVAGVVGHYGNGEAVVSYKHCVSLFLDCAFGGELTGELGPVCDISLFGGNAYLKFARAIEVLCKVEYDLSLFVEVIGIFSSVEINRLDYIAVIGSYGKVCSLPHVYAIFLAGGVLDDKTCMIVKLGFEAGFRFCNAAVHVGSKRAVVDAVHVNGSNLSDAVVSFHCGDVGKFLQFVILDDLIVAGVVQNVGKLIHAASGHRACSVKSTGCGIDYAQQFVVDFDNGVVFIGEGAEQIEFAVLLCVSHGDKSVAVPIHVSDSACADYQFVGFDSVFPADAAAEYTPSASYRPHTP